MMLAILMSTLKDYARLLTRIGHGDENLPGDLSQLVSEMCRKISARSSPTLGETSKFPIVG